MKTRAETKQRYVKGGIPRKTVNVDLDDWEKLNTLSHELELYSIPLVIKELVKQRFK